jgi:hypothetical protein
MMPKRIIILFLCIFLFCSCFESSNPLSDPSEAKVDERLKGVWVCRGDEEGQVFYIHFIRGDKDPFTYLIRSAGGDVDNKGNEPIIFFPTHLDSGSYLNVLMWQPKNGKFSDDYIFYKYEFVDGNTLNLWPFANRQPIIEAIRNNELRGHFTSEGNIVGSVNIFDDSERIAEFIVSYDQEIFGDEPLVFHKIPER